MIANDHQGELDELKWRRLVHDQFEFEHILEPEMEKNRNFKVDKSAKAFFYQDTSRLLQSPRIAYEPASIPRIPAFDLSTS